MSASYKTIEVNGTAEYRDRNSLFVGFAQSCHSPEEAKEFISSIKKLHPKASHHCYAWRLGITKNVFRSTDNGEPSGTAGKPILGQIDSNSLTDICVVVVRYFGGILLGTGGLVNAYRTTASDTIKASGIIEKLIPDQYKIETSNQLIYEILRWLKNEKIHIKKFEASLFSVIECDADELIIQKLQQRFLKLGELKITKL